ncbi:hypothetical protein ACWD25_18535 [Streptomyces sp. NPDC002920]
MNSAVAVGLLAICGAGVKAYLTIRLWKDPGSVTLHGGAMRIYPLSEEFRRGMVRASVATAAGLAFGGLLVLADGIWRQSHQGPAQGVMLDILRASLAGILLCGVVYLSIALFNVPKFLVPPHMRNEPGSIAARQKNRTSDRR